MDGRSIEIIMVSIGATVLLASAGGAAIVLSSSPTIDPPMCSDDRLLEERPRAD